MDNYWWTQQSQEKGVTITTTTQPTADLPNF